MTLHNVDVAAALYREEPVTLYYLSHDPVEAAAQALDAHVTAGQLAVVTMLSNAWHERNPNVLPIDETSPLDQLYKRRSPPPSGSQATLHYDNPDPFYKESAGDKPYWLLKGQRIGEYRHFEHANAEWARASRANYNWAWQYGLALAEEFRRRWGYYTLLLPQLWTLEDAPPWLDAEVPTTQPSPVVPANSIVMDEDGYYDTVGSYRAYYLLHKRSLFKWTGRPEPAWVKEAPTG